MAELENKPSKRCYSFIDFLRSAMIQQYEAYKFFGASLDRSTFPVCLVTINNIILVASNLIITDTITISCKKEKVWFSPGLSWFLFSCICAGFTDLLHVEVVSGERP